MTSHHFRSGALLAVALLVAGCPSSNPSPGTGKPDTPIAPVATIEPACSGCSAVSPTQYSGQGTGVWAYSNGTDQPVSIPVSLRNLKGQNVSLVFSNDSGDAQPMPMTAQGDTTRSRPQAAEQREVSPSFGDQVRAFNQSGWGQRIEKLRALRGEVPPTARDGGDLPEPTPAAQLGDSRQWHDGKTDTPRDTTLMRQSTTSDGVTVNFWLEDSESDAEKVTGEMLDTLSTQYTVADGIYDFLIGVGGPLWGAHNLPELIGGTGQAVNIVFMKMDETGLAGFFSANNAFTRNPSEADTLSSNQAVVLFIDTSIMYAEDGGGIGTALLTLAHESIHMQNFYRRGVRLGPDHVMETWLDEGTAVMVEDFMSGRLLATYNEIADTRLPQYTRTPLYACPVFQWPEDREACDGYGVWGAWGGYLNRQFGIDFFRNLLNDSTNKSSTDMLDAAIRSVRPQSGTVPELRRWAASVGALIPAENAPSGYGYPARTETGYALPAIDLQTLAAERKLPTPGATLPAHSVLPMVRRNVTGTFIETVVVPPRTTLSVIIHDGKV
ncbi:hypothetical protein [Cupriavidus sp. SW-Y-13]|uniref:M30 family zinc metallopeptidase n=1 Tax=Cupriavidus sp. SW-Y-13 TaxID=2653854 RepID=UPI001365C8F7|nr:hypothetical protein [Cupriavidus sp. SW-Y-13]MWL89817.1 hypothetical protein [Cupriavidus sp. SW-Y-13]